MKPLCKIAAFALAFASSLPTAQATGTQVDLSVVDRQTGETLPVWRHQGQYWIAGTPGHRYGVTLNNNQHERSLVVLSVDGVNVISGETAAWDQTGYVLDKHQSTRIDGWRKSQTQIASFVFTALPDSYASRTGRPQNVGVIAIARFRERPAPLPPPVISSYHSEDLGSARSSNAESPAPAPADKARRSEQLGTGHGQREYSAIGYTDFERASPQPDEVVAIRYASRGRLIALGVIPTPPRPRVQPDPFPGSRGFVPDPPSWR